MPASSHPASYPNQNSDAYGDSESNQRAVLDLAGHPVQSDVAELGGFVAKKHGLVASQAPAAAYGQAADAAEDTIDAVRNRRGTEDARFPR
jgi:hypothetical protein